MPSEAPGTPLLRVAALFYGALLLAAALVVRATGLPLFYASPAAAARGVRPLADAAAGVAFAALALVLSRLWTRRSASGERVARALAGLLGRRGAGECAVLALLSGVAEEAFFRGALQPRFGLAATSALFALAHLAPRRELLPWTLFAGLAGLGLGALFAWTGNLVAPVVAHVLVNAVNLRLLSRDYAPE